MKRLVLPTLVLAAAAWSPRASADTAYTITETLIGEWLWDNGNGRYLFDPVTGEPVFDPVTGEPSFVGNIDDDYYWDIKNRLNIGMQGEGIDVGLRVDTATLRFLYPAFVGDETDAQRADREREWYRRYGVEQDPEDGSYGHVGDYRLERAYAALDLTRDWRVTGGDYYAQLGRGLILSLRKEDELGLDTALRGARVDGRIADRVDLTLLAGLVNVTNVNERNNLISEDPLDLISAVRASVDLWGGNRVSLHVMDYSPHRDDAILDNLVAYGGALEFLDLPYDLQVYAEADGVHRASKGASSDDGFGAYLDVSGMVGPVQLRLEYKEYHDLGDPDLGISSSEADATGAYWQYNRPPTADELDQWIESQYDVRGGRLRVDWKIADWVSIFVACAAAQDLRSVSEDAVHGYGGFEISWDDGQSVLRGTVGYRHTWDEAPVTHATEDFRTLVHVKVDLGLHLWGPLSLNLNVLHEEWTQLNPGGAPGEMTPYRRGTTALSLDWAGIGGIWGTFEYDTEKADVQHWFGAGGIQWFAADWLTVRGRVGSQRGGRKCLAGMCRDFPAFEGVRLELVFRL